MGKIEDQKDKMDIRDDTGGRFGPFCRFRPLRDHSRNDALFFGDNRLQFAICGLKVVVDYPVAILVALEHFFFGGFDAALDFILLVLARPEQAFAQGFD